VPSKVDVAYLKKLDPRFKRNSGEEKEIMTWVIPLSGSTTVADVLQFVSDKLKKDPKSLTLFEVKSDSQGNEHT
jgi:hypothetical protein